MRGIVRFAVLIASFTLIGSPASAIDWPWWRGPEQTGATREKAAVSSWSQDGENLLWKSDVGGRTTPIVMDGRVFLIAPVGSGIGSGERVVCLDADTGKTIWEHRFNVFSTDIVENRVGWTALAGDPETGNIYAHATGGEFFAYDRDGKILWKHSLTEEYGRISGYGGRLHTPIVDENRVIVSFLNSGWGSHGKPTHRYVAFDKSNGDILWWAEPGGVPLDTTYAVPAVAVIDGVRQLIAATADGNVYGMKARTGERLWTYRLSKRGLNVSIVVDGPFAYTAHSEENVEGTVLGTVVCIDARQRGDITDGGTVWRRDGLRVGYASPAIVNDRLYVVDNSANLYALDAKSGDTKWEFKLGTVGKGSPTVTADGVIYVGEQNGIFHILRDEDDRCVSLDREEFTRDDHLVDEIFGSPAIADGRVYFQSRYGAYCLASEQREPVKVKIAGMPPQPQGEPDDVNWAGIVPAEVILKPGEQVDFDVMLFDAKGERSTRVSKLTAKPDAGADGEHGHAFASLSTKWSAQGAPGSINEEGVFTATDDDAFAAGLVKCTLADGLEAVARVRVAPDLPIDEDFEGMKPGSVPSGWIGAGGGRVKIDERDGSRVLRKLAPKEKPSPPFMRLHTDATAVIEGGCTSQVDLLGTVVQKRRLRFLPDMGMINSRYRMLLLGTEPALRIESWAAMPRLREDVPFEWEPDVWYTMRFQVKLKGDKALLRGKVWRRDSAEPGEWTIEVEDPYPNTEGTAGLYAYSNGTTAGTNGTEVFYDNFKVMLND